MSLVVGLVVVFGLTGCDTSGFCGANQIISFVFCRSDDSDSTPAVNIPPPPAVPNASPSASITPSRYVTTLDQAIELDGSWGDSDGHVVKFEWDLNDDGEYEISGSPAADNHDRRTLTTARSTIPGRS